jgi:HTH-type transcriptional regulator, competence development regulator
MLASLLQLDRICKSALERCMAPDGQIARETFGKKIQRLRRESGLTQRTVASQLGIDFTYLSKLENDRGEPPGEETVRRLGQLLRTDVEELLALAGKVPVELRSRAQHDIQFARFLRQLPRMSDKELKDIYRRAKVPPPEH